MAGLKVLGASLSLDLLIRASRILFGDALPPQDTKARWDAMPEYPDDDSAVEPAWCDDLGQVDDEFYKSENDLGELLSAFAENKGLIVPFEREDAEQSAG